LAQFTFPQKGFSSYILSPVYRPSEDAENYNLEYSFHHMPGSLPAQPQQIYSSQPELNDNWTKVSYKRRRLTQEETEREAKHTKERDHRLNESSTFSHYTALVEEESEEQQQKLLQSI
jgi:hypothetical protein